MENTEEIKLKKTQELERQKLQEAEMKEFVNSFSSRKGKDKVLEIAKWVGNGIFMGASDAVPGYSGGTTLALIGFFKKLIIVARAVFVPKYGISRRRALLFMIPFAIGWIAGVFGIAKGTEAMAHNGLGLELVFFFTSFVLATIPVYLRSIKIKSSSNKRELPKWKKFSLIGIGFLIVITLALIVQFVDGGADFSEHAAGKNKYDLKNWWILSLVAFGAGMVTLVPGGSGAIIQLLSGKYDDIHWTIMGDPFTNIWGLLIFAFSTFFGMVTMVFIMSWFLAKRERMLEMYSLGMLLASPVALLIVPQFSTWDALSDWRHIAGIIGASVLGAGFGTFINIITKRAKDRANNKAAINIK